MDSPDWELGALKPVLAPVHTLVDPKNPLKRDVGFFEDDPTLSRMANCVRYMRTHELYLPPNKWPEGMFLIGIDEEHRVCCAFMMLLNQFEEIPEGELFELCNPTTITLYFIPVPTMPASNVAAQNWINGYFSRVPQDEFNGTLQYLEANRWYLRKGLYNQDFSG